MFYIIRGLGGILETKECTLNSIRLIRMYDYK